MKTAIAAAALLTALATAQAHEVTYDIVTTWYEPQTQPDNTIFQGRFTYDEHTHEIIGLQGMLSEAMTGMMPMDGGGMNWLSLSHQLVSWHDAVLGGTFAAVFRNADTLTFTTMFGGDGWSPAAGIAVGGVHAGFPLAGANPGNAYALIFVPEDPLAPLTQAQIDKLAYADCAPGGMMMSACMTGTSIAGYGSAGTMDGYPVSQTITVAVPEPAGYALMLAGGAVVGLATRRRRRD